MKPRLVVSACLGFEACRYDGAMLQSPFLQGLAPYVALRRVCPEVAIGLGTPRDPIEIVSTTRGRRLVQPSTGQDLTRAMDAFARTFLDRLPPVDGFLLKSRSPSCGVRDAKRSASRGPGLFAEAVASRLPEVAVEDEARLEEPRRREHFLARIFLSAELRAARSRAGWVAFHERHADLFHAWNATRARRLDRWVATPRNYGVELRALLGRLPPQAARPAVRALVARRL